MSTPGAGLGPRGLLLAWTALLVLAGAAAGASGAVPPGPVIGLSADGEQFADALEVPLLDPTVVWVPGDRRTAELHVRNQAADAANLSVEVRGARSTPGWLGVHASVGDRWHRVDATGTGPLGVALGPGETRRVVLRLTMAEAAPPRAMRVSTGLRFRVRLTEAAQSGTDASPPPVGDGLLPGTGTSLGPAVLLLGLTMLLGGVSLLRSRSEP